MVFEAFAEFDATVGGGLHQMNPAPRRFGLQMQSPIGRALIQTETAMNALIELGQVERGDLGVISLILGDVLHELSLVRVLSSTFLKKL